MGKNKYKKNENKTITKTLLGSPFELDWPELEKGHNKLILDELKRELPKKLQPRERPANRDRNKNRDSGQLKTSKEIEEGQSRTPTKKTGPSDKPTYRDHLLLGINAVTRALEKGPLQLVLVCKSANPPTMTKHLLLLSAMQDTPACLLAGLNDVTTHLFGVRSVLALGFKRTSDDYLEDLIAFISDKIPNLNVPWLKIWREEKATIENVHQDTEKIDSNVKTTTDKESCHGQNEPTESQTISTWKGKRKIADEELKVETVTRKKMDVVEIHNVKNSVDTENDSSQIMKTVIEDVVTKDSDIVLNDEQNAVIEPETESIEFTMGTGLQKKKKKRKHGEDIIDPETESGEFILRIGSQKKKKHKKRKREEDIIYKFKTPNFVTKLIKLNKKKKKSK